MTQGGWLAGLLALGLSACALGAPPPDGPRPPLAEEAAALDAFSVRWRAAYEAGDFGAMNDLYEPDAWLMTRGQPARRSREAILAYFAASREAGARASIVFETEEITVDGPYAFKIAKWWLESPEAVDEPVRDSGRSFVIFRRGADGNWRLWRDIDNNTPDVSFAARPE